jgi:tryptophanyl-tRNA synthetase
LNFFSILFLGAIKKWIDLQNSGDNLIVMLADLHAVTIPREPDVLRYEVRNKKRTFFDTNILGNLS